MSISIDIFLKSQKFIFSASHQYILNIKASGCVFSPDYVESLANHALGCTCGAPHCGFSPLLPALSYQNRGRSRPSHLQHSVLLDSRRKSPSSGDGSPAKQKPKMKMKMLLFPSSSLRHKKRLRMLSTLTMLPKWRRRPPPKALKLHQTSRALSIRRSTLLKRRSQMPHRLLQKRRSLQHQHSRAPRRGKITDNAATTELGSQSPQSTLATSSSMLRKTTWSRSCPVSVLF